jgi:hypothetical protein
MGIGEWIRSLLGGPSGACPCTLCHRPIPAGDLHKGIAVIVARRHYCRGCVLMITGQTKEKSQPGWRIIGDPGSSSSVVLP